MPAYTHWRLLEEQHWAALDRCCRSALGRAQIDHEVAQPLLELGWIEERGFGYAPTPRGHVANEDQSMRQIEPPSRTWYGPEFVDRDPPYQQPPIVAVTTQGPLSNSYVERHPNSWPWISMLVGDGVRAALPLVVLIALLAYALR